MSYIRSVHSASVVNPGTLGKDINEAQKAFQVLSGVQSNSDVQLKNNSTISQIIEANVIGKGFTAEQVTQKSSTASQIKQFSQTDPTSFVDQVANRDGQVNKTPEK